MDISRGGDVQAQPPCNKPMQFRHILPSHRLGTSHDSLGSFRMAVAVTSCPKPALATTTVTTTRTTTTNECPPPNCGGTTALTVGSKVSPPTKDTGDKSSDQSSDSSSCPGDDSDATRCGSIHETKEYSLIVVTTHDVRRVLLGMKHRGFGMGLHNSFGGKVEDGESIDEAARRELHEETGICVELGVVKNSHLGTLYFTFEDSPTEMVVHLFHVRIRLVTKEEGEKDGNEADPEDSNNDGTVPVVDPGTIRGCEEITPRWFEVDNIPLDNMFADDSVWLTRLLDFQQQKQHLVRHGTLDGEPAVPRLDGWFHFAPGGADVNTVLHYHLQLRGPSPDRLPGIPADPSQHEILQRSVSKSPSSSNGRLEPNMNHGCLVSRLPELCR